MANNLRSTRDIAMKLGMVVLNRIIVKLTKLQVFTFCMKKLFKKNLMGGGGGGRNPPIPSWIPRLIGPTVEFSKEPVSYKKICKVINRMKSSGSPCPLDQISIICFKRCPYLRSTESCQ